MRVNSLRADGHTEADGQRWVPSASILQANHSPDRLRRPLVRDGARLVETDWDTAMGRVVARSKELLDGPGGWGHFGFCEQETAIQLKWLRTRMRQAAPQALVVAE